MYNDLTQDLVKSLLSYDPETGAFKWTKPRRGVKVGSECGRVNGHGYREIGIAHNLIAAHRVAWLYMTGQLPDTDIDHINQDRADNRWGNLRLATRSQNSANVFHHKRARAGKYQGVTFDAQRGKYRAQIRLGGVKKNLGRFKTEHEAARAYNRAALLEFGEYATINNLDDANVG